MAKNNSGGINSRKPSSAQKEKNNSQNFGNNGSGNMV